MEEWEKIYTRNFPVEEFRDSGAWYACKMFIQELLEKEREELAKKYLGEWASLKAAADVGEYGYQKGLQDGAQTERARWINQPANKHDEKIRAAERARLRKLVEGKLPDMDGYIDSDTPTKLVVLNVVRDLLSLVKKGSPK